MSRDGESLELRPKTYRVLLYLLERPNRLVTKEELIAEVWEGAAVTDDVLVRCIADLRKAFQDDSKAPRILKTFPKMGYGLMAAVENVTAAPAAPPAAAPVSEIAPARRRLAPILLLAVVGLAVAFAWWAVRRGATAGRESEAEVGWWKLDEGRGAVAGDSSVNHRAGAIHGAVSWAAGEGRPSLAFQGVDSVVAGTDARALPAGDRPRTISLWVRPAAPRLGLAGLFAYGAGLERTPDRFEMALNIEGVVHFGSPAVGSHLLGRAPIPTGEWHMVTGIYEGPPSHRAAILIDGVLDREAILNPPPATDNRARWQIAQGLRGGSFRGDLRDVRVYAEPLTEAQVRDLYRCSAGKHDLGGFYYLPVFGNSVVIEEPAPGGGPASVYNGGVDFAGIQFGRAGGACALADLRGVDAGQDLRISMDILVPSDAAGHVTTGGPYFRSRRAMGGDGLIGGSSAGYWVQLNSSGMILVKRLNPQDVVAYAAPTPDFDSSRYHRLAIEARGEVLRVWLDGAAVELNWAGERTREAPIPAVWDGPPGVGHNDGAAGVAFGNEPNRGAAGGQRVRNLSLVQLPRDAR